MITKAIWLLLLGTLGIAAPFVLRARATWPRWLLYAAELLLGLNTALWGLWGLIESMTMVSYVGRVPIFWTVNFIASLLEIALPGLFAVNIIASLLAKGASSGSKSPRTVSLMQIGAGVLAVAVAATLIALVAGVEAP